MARADLDQRYGIILAVGSRVFIHTKEALNSTFALGVFTSRDSLGPSLIFGIIKLIRGRAFFFESAMQCVLHFRMDLSH